MTDGTSTTPSNLLEILVDLEVQNSPPVVDLNGGEAGINFQVSFVGSDVVAVGADAQVSDADGNCIQSMTIRILEDTNGLEGLFAETIGTGVSLRFDQSSGTLQLSNCRPASEYTSVLRTVHYFNDGQAAQRTIEITASDGFQTSDVATSNIIA